MTTVHDDRILDLALEEILGAPRADTGRRVLDAWARERSGAVARGPRAMRRIPRRIAIVAASLAAAALVGAAALLWLPRTAAPIAHSEVDLWVLRGTDLEQRRIRTVLDGDWAVAAAGEWPELDVSGGTRLALLPGALLRLAMEDGAPLATLAAGDLEVAHAGAAPFSLAVPHGRVRFEGPARVRLSVPSTPGVEPMSVESFRSFLRLPAAASLFALLAVAEGSAIVVTPQGETNVDAGTSVRIDDGGVRDDLPPLPKPGKEHRILEELAGKWTVVRRIRPEPSAPWIETKGTDEAEIVAGGFFLLSTIREEGLGMRTEGRMFFGYDPMKKEYVFSSVYSTSPLLMSGAGTFDETKRLFTLRTSLDYPGQDEPVAFRTTMDLTKKGVLQIQSFVTQNGKEILYMEATHTRIEAPQPAREK